MIEHELYFEGEGFLFSGRITFPYRLNVGDIIDADCVHPQCCEVDDTETEGIVKEDGNITKKWFDFIYQKKDFVVKKIIIFSEGAITAELEVYDNKH